MAKKWYERSIIGRALADRFFRLDPRLVDDDELRKGDTLDLVVLLESLVSQLVGSGEGPTEEAARAIRAAKHGDRGVLGKYLRTQKDWGPFPPELRAAVVEIVCGKKRSANRPPVAATVQGHIALAVFVAAKIFGGWPYAEAVEEARKAYCLRDTKTVENACRKYAEGAAEVVCTLWKWKKIETVGQEILRRGELEHSERARDLLQRHEIELERLQQTLDGDDEARLGKITLHFFS